MVVYPVTRDVDVYTPGADPMTLGVDDTLDGGSILPGLRIAVKDIFPTH